MMNRLLTTFLLFFLVLPLTVIASNRPLVETNDSGSSQLTSYYDLRDRETYVQVSNISALPVNIHVQIFQNDVLGCPELNFFDTLTGNDTHIYDLRNLAGNALPVNISLDDNSNGFVVITEVGAASGGSPALATTNLIGNFRILDQTGYEYRTNSSGNINDNSSNNDERVGRLTFNFNQIGANNQSDIVAISFGNGGSGFSSVSDRSLVFAANIFDNAERPTSCDFVNFFCGGETDALNQGINNIFPNTNGDNLICLGNTTPSGFVELIVSPFFNTGRDTLIGFAGLNNANGMGSMDSMVANPEGDLSDLGFQFPEFQD